MERICVIATVYNRVETTLTAFRSLDRQQGLGQDFDLQYFVVDDLSSDGTADALKSEFGPKIQVTSGTGDMFWSGGMAAAHALAAKSNPDWMLWLNDDVDLDHDAIRRLLASVRECSRPTIAVGAMQSRSTQSTTYSGMLKTGAWPGGLSMIHPTSETQSVDAFHGNLVLVPREIYTKLGGVDGRFEHAYGDIDYGLRAKRAGFLSILCPGHFGYCETNSTDGTWLDDELSSRLRFKLLLGRKGYPFRSHVLYNRKHGGIIWPLYLMASYVRAIIRIVRTGNHSKKLDSKSPAESKI